ncbi:MAG: glutamate synthase subunit beta [Candidatus Riflebacteria bacterium]|nr:glutamate synthase subunit beta [Candidatus Riflebacteria bacterium]
MGKPTGFLEYSREVPQRRPVLERLEDWNEVYIPFSEEKAKTQSARCMDCGIPFCHTGCPLNNVIPHWNDLIYKDRWKEAIRVLHSTNNFPEFTGTVCPALCESSCVLGINESPVSVKAIERSIIEYAFQHGWITPESPKKRTEKTVAVVGSGPSGLAAAQQLNRAGHRVTVYEKNAHIGGLLRYGVPDFKFEKNVLNRRIEQLQEEGIVFITKKNVGVDISAQELRRSYDAILLCGGTEASRDLKVPGRGLKGINFAMEFLPQQNRRIAGEKTDPEKDLFATGKRVIVIGGGDTGADCLGTSLRQKAASVHQFEIMPKPPLERALSTPWPLWPLKLRTESSHEEGGIREWGLATTKFEGNANGIVTKLHAIRVGPPPDFHPVAGTEFSLDADLVILAMGFSGPAQNGLLDELGVALDTPSTVSTDKEFMSTVPGIFSAGDMRRGQSLVVWAISEGRNAARCIDKYLMGASSLPS